RGCCGVDLHRPYRCRTGPRRCDGGQTTAGGEVQHRLSDDLGGIVEQVPREALTTGPGEGPERRRLVAVVFALGQLPESNWLLSLEQRELGNEGDRFDPQMGADECGQGLGHTTILP